MKTRFAYILSLMVTSLFIFSQAFESIAQTSNPEILMKFQRKADGKVVDINAVGQKVFEFTVIGLNSQADISNFKARFTGREYVFSVNISESTINGERTGSIILDRSTHGGNVKELLIKAGITNISIDGEVKPVEEIGKDKNGKVSQ